MFSNTQTDARLAKTLMGMLLLFIHCDLINAQNNSTVAHSKRDTAAEDAPFAWGFASVFLIALFVPIIIWLYCKERRGRENAGRGQQEIVAPREDFIGIQVVAEKDASVPQKNESRYQALDQSIKSLEKEVEECNAIAIQEELQKIKNKLEEFKNKFFCSFAQGIAEYPCRLPSGRVFEYHDISEWSRIKNYQNLHCPLTRFPYSELDLKPCQETAKLIPLELSKLYFQFERIKRSFEQSKNQREDASSVMSANRFFVSTQFDVDSMGNVKIKLQCEDLASDKGDEAELVTFHH